jgi:hypothetical protein
MEGTPHSRGDIMTASERRAEARSLQRFLVRFEDAGELRMAFTENVSAEGLFLKTKYPPPPGEKLRLMVRTARGTRVQRGTVIWSRYNLAHPNSPSAGSGAGIRLDEDPCSSSVN